MLFSQPRREPASLDKTHQALVTAASPSASETNRHACIRQLHPKSPGRCCLVQDPSSGSALAADDRGGPWRPLDPAGTIADHLWR